MALGADAVERCMEVGWMDSCCLTWTESEAGCIEECHMAVQSGLGWPNEVVRNRQR